MENKTGVVFPKGIKTIPGLKKPVINYDGGEFKDLVTMVEISIERLKISQHELDDLFWSELTQEGTLSKADAEHLFKQYKEAGQKTMVRFLIEDKEPYLGYWRTINQLIKIAEKRNE